MARATVWSIQIYSRSNSVELVRRTCCCRFWLVLSLVLAFNVFQLVSQSPVKIIFDTDMGSDCDDVGALALLHAYADMNKAEILACIYSSGKVRYGAGVIDAINTYYGRPDIPIGAYHGAEVGDSVDKMSAERLAKQTDLYKNTVVSNADVPDQATLLRKVLSGQPDQSVVYLTVGHTKGLYDLMKSETDKYSSLDGEALIRKKIKKWIALGALDAANPKKEYRKDWNFYFNGTVDYTKYLVEHFPCPIYYVSAGTNVMTGASLKSLDKGIIVRDAYESWLNWYGQKTLDDQRPSWDLIGVYVSVNGTGDYLVNLGTGNLLFDPEKGCLWQPGVNTAPLQYFIQEKPEVQQPFADYLNSMIAQKPRQG